MAKHSHGAETINVSGTTYRIHSIAGLGDSAAGPLPLCHKILLENLLRKCDGKNVTQADIKAVIHWDPQAEPTAQVAFSPARVVLQDFTGVPAIVDLAAMRDAVARLGGDPDVINPLQPVDLVIDHSVMVDHFGSPDSLDLNMMLEFQRNKERYRFLKWGQQAFNNFRVVPPATGIVHQVNLEYLGSAVMTRETDAGPEAFPDTLVGTDSHTTMINGLGVLGWGVGGIEAEAAMLGQPITMLLPQVVGFELRGRLAEGATATDLVLTVTQMLRQLGVVGKFVEFFGDGLSELPLADRATIANMAPEYGATCGLFPIDVETLKYLRLTGRDEAQIALVEAYARTQTLWREDGATPARYSATLSLDLGEVVPSIAGPRRPQDRIPLTAARSAFMSLLEDHGHIEATDNAHEAAFNDEGGQTAAGQAAARKGVPVRYNGQNFELEHGAVVIAAITSCTNTSNPAVLVAAGLLAKKAIAAGLTVKPWVKTSFAPGSQVVPAYLEKAGLLDALATLGFDVVGFGCTTCIGNSGPLPDEISQAIRSANLTVSAVLSGNRNFEGRIHADVRSNYLASPPLVVAYALAGSLQQDLYTDPLGVDAKGQPVFLKDLWPSQSEIHAVIEQSLSPQLYQERYADVFRGPEKWQILEAHRGKTYSWPASGYIQNPPFFAGMSADLPEIRPIQAARCLVKVGDSITTDHISPAGAIGIDSPAGQYLLSIGVKPADFNSLGSRRGNHEVMMRGTFANVRLRNELAPGSEGSATIYYPAGERTSIYDAAMRYQQDGTPLVVLAGKEYGTGSSRDWAAKGTKLLGIQAVIAESFERIHRSNLVGFGVLPLQFAEGVSATSLGLAGDEIFSIADVSSRPGVVTVTAEKDGKSIEFQARVRIDTPTEWDYYQHGGILHYVIRQLIKD